MEFCCGGGLHPFGDVHVDGFAAEEAFRKFGHLIGVIQFAAEDVQVYGIGQIRKVARNQRRFDELQHRVSGDAFILAEVHDLALSKPAHLDQITQFHYEAFDRFGVPNGIGVTVIDVQARQ